MKGVHDVQTVTATGAPVGPTIHDVVVRPLVALPDPRGEVCELYRGAWGVHPDPLVYAYLATVEPGVAKAWIRHHHQDDRIACMFGRLLWVLYDDRDGSPTRGVVQRFTSGDRNRVLFTIPAGVWHGVQNVGTAEAAFLNLPTRPYDHETPDKERLPADTDLIPYRFRGLDPRSG